MAAAGPPAVRKTRTVGEHAVPVVTVMGVDESGQTIKRDMVDLSKGMGIPLFKWLWGPLGMSWNDFHHGHDAKAPLTQEIQKAIAAPRGSTDKHQRDGKLFDNKGKMLASLTSLDIRGRELLARNDGRRLQLNLVDSVELLSWFVNELW